MHIITVTYEKEISLLELQAISISKFWTGHIDKISIVFNGDNLEAIKQIKNYIFPLYGKFRDKVELIESEEHIDGYEKTGWRSQQFLKLTVSAKSRFRHVLILDSKNHFVKPVAKSDFISEDGLCLSHFEKHGVMNKYLDACFDFLGFDGKYPQEILPCVTPYALEPSLVREVIYYCEKIKGQKFDEIFFRTNRMITEFFLIFAYLVKFNVLGSHFKIRERSNFITLFKFWPDTPEKWEWAMNRVNDNDVKAFGLHSGRVPKLTNEQKSAVIGIWSESKLVNDIAEAESVYNKILSEAC